MDATQFLTELQARGIELTAADGKLKVTGPAGTLTPGLQTQLRIHKHELLSLLAPLTLPGLVAPLPARWVFPEIAGGFADLPADGWPLKLYREPTAEWVEFANLGELQAAALEDTRLSLPQAEGWRGGR